MLTEYVQSKKDFIKAFLTTIGVSAIKNPDLMLQAFVHKSYAADFIEKVHDNERLEFLGDSILGAIVCSTLYTNFPQENEDQLTLYKIALIREETLAATAKEIGLDKHIFISNGEEKTDGRNKEAILADCLEALIGYIFIDNNYRAAETFVKKYIYSKIEKIEEYIPVKSYKSRVQEMIQKQHKTLPNYVDSEHQVDQGNNVITYKTELYVEQKLVATWFWPSKKKAQEEAAKKFLEEQH